MKNGYSGMHQDQERASVGSAFLHVNAIFEQEEGLTRTGSSHGNRVANASFEPGKVPDAAFLATNGAVERFGRLCF